MLRASPLVALVDDDEAIRKALSRVLRACEFGVEGFSSGQAFLNALSETHPDCVLLDLHMPDMDGLEVLRELHSRAFKAPVIIITAHDEPGIRAYCLATGATAYLSKPIDRSVLQQAITDAVR
jgi:FixJ family two-component response regulator